MKNKGRTTILGETKIFYKFYRTFAFSQYGGQETKTANYCLQPCFKHRS